MSLLILGAPASQDLARPTNAQYAGAVRRRRCQWKTIPRAVFERLFGDGGTTNPGARLARLKQEASILDSVTQAAADLGRELGQGDRIKLNEYLDAIRDVERRIQKTEEQNGKVFPVIEHPAGIPASFSEHTKLMYDLWVLAYQADLTRVITFMIGHELTGQTYPEIGVPDAWHAISHHQGDPVNLASSPKSMPITSRSSPILWRSCERRPTGMELYWTTP